MTGESLVVVQDQLEKLKQLFPETITEGKIDWEKLQATLGKENIEFSNERYVLNWAGKSEAFKVLQQTTTATLKPVPEESINFDTTENVFIEGENLEVLKVLQKSYYGKVKVVCIDPPYNTGNDSFIYPDSFKESKEEYQKRIGEKDEEGYLMKEGFFRKNSRDSGHYHSNWLSMMYPRLFLAKNLLRDDGVIFVHIDDNEVHNLRMIMNEIFGEENFIAELITVKSKNGIGDKKGFATNQDYIITYQKNDTSDFAGETLSQEEINEYNKEDDYGKYKIDGLLRKKGEASSRKDRPNMYYPLYFNPKTGEVKIEDTLGFEVVYPKKEDGTDGRWVWGIENCKENTFKLFAGSKGTIYIKNYLTDNKRKKTRSLLDKPEYLNDRATNETKEVFGFKAFSTPKPVKLISTLIENVCGNNDIILDFFGGSGTTAQAVLELNKEDGGNRKFILVQLPEPCDEESEAFKAGYKTVADISKERIRRVIKRLNHGLDGLKDDTDKPEPQQQMLFKAEVKNQLNPEISLIRDSDIGFKVFKLSSSSFKIWRGGEITEDNLEQQLEMFTNPVRKGSEKENMLYELILKAGYLLTDSVEYKNKLYYVKGGELILALEEINQKIIDTILTPAPSGRAGAGLQKVITLDQLFTGNDQLKTNAVLQMKDAEIDFKTI